MIKLKNVNEVQKYFELPEAALAFIRSLNADTPVGKYPFGDDCFVTVSEKTTKRSTPMEAHEKFVDLQYLVSGEEKMLYADKRTLKEKTAYNEEKDVAFYYIGRPHEVSYRAGEAILLYPNDAHAPDRAKGEPVLRKKAVVKIRYK